MLRCYLWFQMNSIRSHLFRSSKKILSRNTSSISSSNRIHCHNRKTFSSQGPKSDVEVKVSIAKKEQPKEQSKTKFEGPPDRYTGNVFVSRHRAHHEYMLTDEELGNMYSTSRRSPFDEDGKITVYLKSDVESFAIKKHGGVENLRKKQEEHAREFFAKRNDKLANLLSPLQTNKSSGGVSDMFRDFRKRPAKEDVDNDPKQKERMVVYTAIGINGTNCAVKFGAFLLTGSSSIFSEVLHSLADTLNQMILAYGVHRSVKKPDPLHPYGYANFSYVASLVSGVGIFFLGAGISWYHGIQCLIHPHSPDNILLAAGLLSFSAISESYTLFQAARVIREKAISQNITMRQFISRAHMPELNVVLMEDLAAVLGLSIAGGCLGLTYYTGNPIFDACGSIVIGNILAGVASFVIISSSKALVGQSISQEKMLELREHLEFERTVRSLYDVKATDIGNSRIRFKAEVDFDGRQIMLAYLAKQDRKAMMEQVQAIATSQDLNDFMCSHGEGVIDQLGSEIDRIEKNLKKRYPEVRHVDLEVL